MGKKTYNLAPFILLCLIGFATFFSSYLRIPVMPLFAATLGAGPAQVGSIKGAFMLTAGLLSIPSGLLADRIGFGVFLTFLPLHASQHGYDPAQVGLVCLALALIALGQFVQLTQLMACAVVMGVGMALTFTAVGAMIAELVPPVQRGLAMGMYNSCVYLGMMAGATVMGLALKRIGYPLGFAAAGCMALVTLLLFLQMMREKPVLKGMITK